jgi:ectoine hydroxylase-related dioxygenase (phytanoyl-CoA dioxygenase family)
MNAHIDPAGPHQAVVPTLMMSELGRDFREGGAFMKNSKGKIVWIEKHTNPGDVVLFSPKLVHGVAPIDPGEPVNWAAFEGRWMSIFAVNKLATNTRVAEAIDLGKG